jgi:hypothetical protein
MKKLECTEDRFAALMAVHRDQVRYHTGLTGPSVGYMWAESLGGQMFEDMRHVLRDLWTSDLIEVDTHRLFAQGGHRVSTTTNGYLLLRQWQDSRQRQPAA